MTRVRPRRAKKWFERIYVIMVTGFGLALMSVRHRRGRKP